MNRFDLVQFCQLIKDYKITYGYVSWDQFESNISLLTYQAVPPVILLLAKAPIVDKYDLSTIRCLNCGAAPLTKELVTAIYERLKIPVKQGTF
jgi:4-coumarate--CoA ligase